MMFVHAAAVLIALAVSPPAFADPQSPLCRRDMFFVDADYRRSAEKLQRANSPVERCAALRGHVDMLRRSEAVVSRCADGAARLTETRRLATLVDEFRNLIRERCGRS